MAQMKEMAGAGLRFGREELLQAQCLRHRRDLLEALLTPGQKYTLLEAEEQINQFLKGKVK